MHSDVNWACVRFATTVEEVTARFATSGPGHVVSGLGVSGSTATVVLDAEDALPVDVALLEAAPDVEDGLTVEAAVPLEAGLVEPPQADVARHSRPPSAAERRA